MSNDKRVETIKKILEDTQEDYLKSLNPVTMPDPLNLYQKAQGIDNYYSHLLAPLDPLSNNPIVDGIRMEHYVKGAENYRLPVQPKHNPG